MKLTTKILGLLALFFSFSLTASAQNPCFNPHFSIYVSQTATVPNADDPTTQQVSLTQTVTVTGYTSLGSACSSMANSYIIQHWVGIINRLVMGTTVVNAPATSNRSCPACSYTVQSTTAPMFFLEGDDPITESEPQYDLYCSATGQSFFHGTTVFNFLRVLAGASIPDTTLPKSNCKTAPITGIETCDIPVVNWCSIPRPAVRATEITAVVNPQAKWWRTWDLCARITPDNTSPWVCPSFQMKVPLGGGGGIPIGFPIALDNYTTPPVLGYTGCDDVYKP